MAQDVVLLLVPGYSPTPKRNDQLDGLKAGLETVFETASIAPCTRGSNAGWRATTPDVNLEMYELFWQDRIHTLDQSKPWVRVFRGLYATTLWFRPNTLRVFVHSWIWLFYAAVGTALLLLWLYGAIAVLLVSLGSLAPTGQMPALPPGAHFTIPQIEQSLSAWGVTMQKYWLWAWASVIIAFLGVKLDMVANLTDLGLRFMTESDNDVSSVRKVLKRAIAHALDGMPKPGEQVVVVGHSFGTVIAMEAVADGLSTRVELITLGSFLAFLSAEFSRTASDIQRTANSPCLTSWRDYNTTDDWFASKSPLPNRPNISSADLPGIQPWYARLTTNAHAGYFENEAVLHVIFDPIFKKPIPPPVPALHVT